MNSTAYFISLFTTLALYSVTGLFGISFEWWHGLLMFAFGAALYLFIDRRKKS